MEAFFVALAAITVAEFGDKTQLITLYLSARYRRPLAVLTGLTLASLISHGIAALVGGWLHGVLPAGLLHWLVGIGFLAMAAWVLFSHHGGEHDESEARRFTGRGLGPFFATFLVFLVLEMGDKTQFTTLALATRFDALGWVLLGAVCGMIAANLPALWLGQRFADRLPVALMRRLSAALFALIGLVLLGHASLNG